MQDVGMGSGFYLFRSTLCLKKNIPNIFDCNLNENYHYLIIFGTDIPETVSHQIAFSFPPHTSSVSALPGECRTNEILHFTQCCIIT